MGESMTIPRWLFATTLATVLVVIVAVFFRREVSSSPGTDAMAEFVDLGEVTPGAQLSEVLRLPNRSSQTLTIRNISRDCVCLVDEILKKTAAPGDFFEVRLSYLAQKLRGEFKHTIQLYFEEIPEAYAVFIHGRVGGWVTVEPERLRIEGILGQPISGTITAIPVEPWPLTELDVECSNPSFRVQPKAIDPHRIVVTVSIVPEARLELGNHTGEVTLSWRGKDRFLVLPVEVNLFPRFQSIPTQVVFDAPRDSGGEFTLDIRDRLPPTDGKRLPIRLRTVDLPPSFVAEFGSPPATHEDKQKVKLRLGANAVPSGTFLNGRVEILGEEPQARVLLAIPVIGRIH